jgi:hypothetical protein
MSLTFPDRNYCMRFLHSLGVQLRKLVYHIESMHPVAFIDISHTFYSFLLQLYLRVFFLYHFTTCFGHTGPSFGVLLPKLSHSNLYIKCYCFFSHLRNCVFCLMFSSFSFLIYIVHIRFNFTFKYLKFYKFL